MSLRFAHGRYDPRFYEVDDEFRQVLADLAPMVSASRMSKARFFHRLSTTAAGTIVLPDHLDLPAHSFFRPGRRFDVIARYSNGVEADDIAPAIRGVTLRLQDPGDSEPLLDLSLNTGECFFVRTAEIFRRIALGESQRLAAEIDGFRENAWGLYRHASTYTGYHYYSQAPSGFAAADGTQYLARYRLLPADGTPDTGHVDPGGLLLPPDRPGLSRDAADRRSRSFLHDELRARVLNSPVRGLLQIQLHRVTDSASDNEIALDCTRPWSLPWRDLAVLELDSLVSNASIEPMRFSHRTAPAELGSVLATSPHENASLNHLRALMYEWTSAVRQGEEPSAGLGELLASPRTPTSTVDSRRTVVVVGAGPAGLTTARELERSGHRVVVLEREPEVGGKCESVDIDGHVYDLGGHLCTTQYENVARLAVELGVPTEDTTPHRVYDIGTGTATPQSEAFFERRSFGKYAELRESYFPRIAEAGLAHSAKALAKPVTEWLAEHGLESMAISLGTGYTAAGYGHLIDDLPALYFVKYAEMTGLLAARPELLGHTGSFTVVGGFASLWQKVAAELSDVRCGVTVTAIARNPEAATGGIRIDTDQGEVIADDLVLSVPIDQLLPVLDATEDETDLAGRVRTMDYYTTIVSATGLPHSAFFLVEEHCRSDAEHARGVAFHHRRLDRDEYAVYSYGAPGLDGDDVVAGIRTDVERMGGQLGAVHTQRRWKFLPHFSSEDISSGIYDRIEALQGARHTFHVGSLPAYELVECNMAYAKRLVRDHFGGASDEPRHPVSPSTVESVAAATVRDWLIEHIAEELRLPRDAIDPGARLDTLALESISVAALQAGLTDLLGFRVPHTLFLQCPTIDAVVGLLTTEEDTTAPETARGLLLDLGQARPFFCVGGAVGAAYYLGKLARDVGSARPFYGVRAPGYDGTTGTVDTVEALAALSLEQIRQVQPTGPYLLGGHSFGGLVAYEMGRQLRAAGEEVERIVLLDSYIAEPGQAPPPADDAAALEELLTINGIAYAADGPVGVRIDPEAGVSERMEQFAKFLGATGTVDLEEYIGAMLRVFQANLEANAKYQPGPSDLDVVLLKATGGFPPVMRPHRNTRLKLTDRANGWEHVEVGALSVVHVPGDHFTMFIGEGGRVLASAVRDCLADRREAVRTPDE